ncbi:hypothetical protein [Salsuginibacillus kocurii]|uniref:hypothetical protein n=1 Tax=Salsuginibacillus kocurii TaxID=427078 RepID=UPI00037E79E8|nr:hypothetical protein [Salsuginibacillus kocurii]
MKRTGLFYIVLVVVMGWVAACGEEEATYPSERIAVNELKAENELDQEQIVDRISVRQHTLIIADHNGVTAYVIEQKSSEDFTWHQPAETVESEDVERGNDHVEELRVAEDIRLEFTVGELSNHHTDEPVPGFCGEVETQEMYYCVKDA